MSRVGSIRRETKETQIELSLDIDGAGQSEISTGVPFFDHMLELFARHGLFDLTVKAVGDLQVDAHHTVEDIGICLGSALTEALGDKRGINRYGDCLMPMDETLAVAAIDISGRPGLVYEVDLPVEMIGQYDTSLTAEFLQAFVGKAGLTLHVRLMSGGNSHHIVEAVFKGMARALGEAVAINPRVRDVPSTKGTL
ncbi:MAG: imidazoleglycerol-phosphate dehydratase HisB [Actinomycetota bacterium]|nr:imidazoleglycerol-phosphate dehydratase HisB [Actinomycetota bacterium]